MSLQPRLASAKQTLDIRVYKLYIFDFFRNARLFAVNTPQSIILTGFLFDDNHVVCLAIKLFTYVFSYAPVPDDASTPTWGPSSWSAPGVLHDPLAGTPS